MTMNRTHITAAIASGVVAISIAFSAGQIKASDDAAMDELLAADRAFAVMASNEGASNAFAAFASEDAVNFPGSEPARGRDAVVASVSGFGPGALSWAPEGGEVSADGTLGYTWGPYSMTEPGNDVVVGRGYYLTVWRKGADGDWKVIADIGSAVEDAVAEE